MRAESGQHGEPADCRGTAGVARRGCVVKSFDSLVIGGGFYGASLARILGEQGGRVGLLERAPELLTRASYVNQARVHHGYHYPRSIMTALRSRINFPRFVQEFEDCLDGDFEMLYAIARDSKVTATQFERICQSIGAPLAPASRAQRDLLDDARVEEVFLVQEPAFDAARLRARLSGELRRLGVEVCVATPVHRVQRAREGGIEIVCEGGERLWARRVFCCAYAQINTILHNSGLPLLPVKNEVAEIPLLRVPPILERIGITIMDGPYFAVMPFPARELHSLHHVRYSPHHYWHDAEGYRDAYDHLERQALHSNRLLMMRDAVRYVPALRSATCVVSLYDVKTVLVQNEVDDGRPILCRTDYGIEGLTLVLGAKVDNVYDVIEALRPTLERIHAAV